MVTHQYKLIKSTDIDAFEKQVTEHLNNGWFLNGNLIPWFAEGSWCYMREMCKINDSVEQEQEDVTIEAVYHSMGLVFTKPVDRGVR